MAIKAIKELETLEKMFGMSINSYAKSVGKTRDDFAVAPITFRLYDNPLSELLRNLPKDAEAIVDLTQVYSGAIPMYKGIALFPREKTK